MRALLIGDRPTLRDLLALSPESFYAQTWYDGELFLNTRTNTHSPRRAPRALPARNAPNGPCLDDLGLLVSAGDLAWAYLNEPDAPVWGAWLWTSDLDRYGQRVYVGAPHGRGFEIHRHLQLDDKWRIATWDDAPTLTPTPEV